ncbi:unnamed protein product, partial [Musa textilis]
TGAAPAGAALLAARWCPCGLARRPPTTACAGSKAASSLAVAARAGSNSCCPFSLLAPMI